MMEQYTDDRKGLVFFSSICLLFFNADIFVAVHLDSVPCKRYRTGTIFLKKIITLFFSGLKSAKCRRWWDCKSSSYFASTDPTLPTSHPSHLKIYQVRTTFMFDNTFFEGYIWKCIKPFYPAVSEKSLYNNCIFFKPT
jgi:hypothetical protein